MSMAFDGRMCLLARAEDGAEFAGQVVAIGDGEWLVSPSGAVPSPGDVVDVELIGTHKMATGTGTVVSVEGQDVVFSCARLIFQDSRAKTRARVDGLVLRRCLKDGVVTVTDISPGGFGFETNVLLQLNEEVEFAVAFNGRKDRIKGVVAHVRQDEDGMYRGGVKLLHFRLADAVLRACLSEAA